MKKSLLTILILSLLILPTFAISVDKLTEAEETLILMDRKISELREFVQLARDGKIREITLTAQQRQDLRDKYDTGKEELRLLYLQLP